MHACPHSNNKKNGENLKCTSSPLAQFASWYTWAALRCLVQAVSLWWGRQWNSWRHWDCPPWTLSHSKPPWVASHSRMTSTGKANLQSFVGAGFTYTIPFVTCTKRGNTMTEFGKQMLIFYVYSCTLLLLHVGPVYFYACDDFVKIFRFKKKTMIHM